MISITLTRSDRSMEVNNITREIDLHVNQNSLGVQRYGSGPAGTNGTDGTNSDKTFVYNLNGETDITIAHNLNKYPSVTVFDSAGDNVEGQYAHLSLNSVRILFSAGFSGKAIFN